MKRRLTSREIAIALALLTIPFIVGCGQNNAPPPPMGATGYPGYGGIGGPGACVPPTGVISFTGTGIYMDAANIRGGSIPPTASSLVAGQTFGEVIVGMGMGAMPISPMSPMSPMTPGVGVYGAGTSSFYRTAVDGTVSLEITSGAGLPYGGTTMPGVMPTMPGVMPTMSGVMPAMGGYMASGTIEINPASLNELYAVAAEYGLMTMPYGAPGMTPGMPYGAPGVTPGMPYGYGGYGAPGMTTGMPYGYGAPGMTMGMPYGGGNVCVSGVAFDVGYSAQTLYGGAFYLYLNDTMHGWVMQI